MKKDLDDIKIIPPAGKVTHRGTLKPVAEIISAEETAEKMLRNLGCKGKWNVNKKKAIAAIAIALRAVKDNTPYPSGWDLNSTEQKELDEFVDGLSKKYKNKNVKLFFHHGNGIGTSKIVKVGKKKKDITDYTSW